MLSPSTVPLESVVGQFQEKEYGKYFEYRNTTNPWALKHNLQHEVFVLDGVRFGNILSTVAYVCTDEDEEGNPVLDKWSIKHQWRKAV
jgi:hypothetical protein